MQVTTNELEKVRVAKAAMNRLQTRVARVKQELETILDDNQKMTVSWIVMLLGGHSNDS